MQSITLCKFYWWWNMELNPKPLLQLLQKIANAYIRTAEQTFDMIANARLAKAMARRGFGSSVPIPKHKVTTHFSLNYTHGFASS